MSVRLFQEFQKKNTAFNHRRLNERVDNKNDFVITIPLKESRAIKTVNGTVALSEEFIKVIEYEYAVRYLERLGITPNATSI